MAPKDMLDLLDTNLQFVKNTKSAKHSKVKHACISLHYLQIFPRFLGVRRKIPFLPEEVEASIPCLFRHKPLYPLLP